MPPFRKPLVLIVEDDATIQHLLERLLRLHAFTPLHATTFAEAISVTRAKKIDAMILDLQLRGGDSGLDVLESLRQRTEYANTPVLVLTGGTLSPHDAETMRGHRTEVLFKPQPMHRVIDYLKRMTG